VTGDAAPLASVLLLTRDAGERFAAVLDAVLRQEPPFPFEVVAVDSESSDGTRERLRRAGVTVVPVRRADFNHGATRNLGIEACRGAFIALLVQDAEPETADWLERLVAPLLEDEMLAGTYGRQLPVEGAGCVARAYQSRYAAAGDTPRVQGVAGPDALAAMPPGCRLEACTFDNVCACIRRTAWQEHRFARVPIAEDLQWAREVMLAGYRLAYVPGARVRHLHDRPAGYELRRTYLVHQQLRRLFDLRTVPSSLHLARAVTASLANHARWILAADTPWRGKLGELPRAAALALALPLGQYLGAKSADSGRDYLRARGV
jgi:rhamnosyltransferase